MARNLRFVVVFATLLVLAGSALGAESKIFGENWFRYTARLDDSELERSGLSVERIYLRWNHKHTDKLESRVTVEMFSSDKSNDANGAGLKIKDAYVKFKGIVPEGDVTVGLQKQYFGRVYDWEYWPIEKAMGERYKVIHGSRDYGVSVGGYIPQGYGTWRVEAVNGEGYKKSGSLINKMPAAIADLRFIPIPGLTAGGSVIWENTGPDTLDYELRLYYTGLARLAKGPVDIWGQFLGGQYGDPDSLTTQMGFMAFPKFSIKTFTDVDLELLGRFDYWDPDTDQDDDGMYMFLAGFNYYFSRAAKGKPGVMVQVVGVRDQPEADGSAATHKIMLQLRWEWSTPKLS
jgi:hypothetical protein